MKNDLGEIIIIYGNINFYISYKMNRGSFGNYNFEVPFKLEGIENL